MSDDDAIDNLYQQIASTANNANRGVKLQIYCEHVWARLEKQPAPPSTVVDNFIALLQSDSNLLLARLVIPDLRPNAATPQNSIKQAVLHGLEPDRPSMRVFSMQPQQLNSAAHAQFLEEKKILREADVYRASILLSGHGNLSESQKQQVQKWLADYPIQYDGSHNTSAADAVGSQTTLAAAAVGSQAIPTAADRKGKGKAVD